MKIIKIVLLLFILSVSGCGLFGNIEKEPSLDSGKDLKIWVGMPYEDAREALLDFNCEDISQYIGYTYFNTGPYFENCWFSFIDSQIGIIGDKEKADDILKVDSFSICNSQQLRDFKHEDWYSFDKLTVSDGEMNIEGLEGAIIYVGLDYAKAKEIINNAGVSDIVFDNYDSSYRTNYKLLHEYGGKETIYEYKVLVYVDLTDKDESSKIIEGIYFNWELDTIYEGVTKKSRHQEVKCGLIDVKHPHGLKWGGKIIE
ncbi:MAG: hypothetical protein K8S87_12365 [Planctomycetes bacterium]|nr:hypothetical protein [Planctomycetota bacterium]